VRFGIVQPVKTMINTFLFVRNIRMDENGFRTPNSRRSPPSDDQFRTPNSRRMSPVQFPLISPDLGLDEPWDESPLPTPAFTPIRPVRVVNPGIQPLGGIAPRALFRPVENDRQTPPTPIMARDSL
jgi:hypothetical protein